MWQKRRKGYTTSFSNFVFLFSFPSECTLSSPFHSNFFLYRKNPSCSIPTISMEMVSSFDFHTLFSHIFLCLLFFSLHVQPYTSPNKCMDLFFMFPIELLNACVNAIEVFPIPPNFIPDKAKLIPGQVGKYLVEHKERIEEEKTRKCERKGYGNQSSKPFPWKWWV